jgi:hypothetical protein
VSNERPSTRETIGGLGISVEMKGMEHVTSSVSRAPRTSRRQAILACAYSAYLALFAGAVAGVVSLFAATGGIAVALLLVGAFAIVAGSGLWAVDVRAARRRPLATVTPLRPAQMVVAQAPRRAAR